MALVINVTTTASPETVLIPLQGAGLNVDIDWGDTQSDTGVTSANPTHAYATAGDYEITITGTAPRLGNDSVSALWTGTLVSVTDWSGVGLTSLQSAFKNFPGASLTVPATLPSGMTNLLTAFYGCSSLTALDVSGWDVSGVTNLQNAFRTAPH